MAVEVGFAERVGGIERIFFFDDLGVAGGAVGIREVVCDAVGEAVLSDELGETVAVGVVGEVDGLAVGVRSTDQLIIEGVNVGDERAGLKSRTTLGGVAVGVVGVAGEAVVGGEGLGLIRQEAA